MNWKMQFNLFLEVVLFALCVISSASGLPAFAGTSSCAQKGEQSESRQRASKASLSKTLKAIVDNPERPLAGLSVVVVRRGKIAYQGYFGNREINSEDSGKSLKVDRNTKFRIASISKLVTAIGIMQMVEQNIIDLDEDAGRYLGFRFRNPNYPDMPVTVRMLMSHTSSVRDGESYKFPPTDTLDQAFVPGGKYWENGSHWAAAGESGKDLSPGKYFDYANLNYGVLGTILEAVSGERFDRYMRTHVILPLGLKASYNMQYFSIPELKQVSVIYRKRDSKENWDPQGPWYAQVDDFHGVPVTPPEGADRYIPGKNATWMAPQGGLRISALDLSRIMRMFLNRGEFKGVRIIKPETVNLMFSPQWTYDKLKRNGDTYKDLMLCYGLGPQILTNAAGDRLLEKGNPVMMGHIGEAYGLLSCMMMDFDRRDGYIYIIGGLGADPEKNRGSYSSFFKWEEEIGTAIFKTWLK
jgi:CubicO group peptidase (beta-lactamase class C family)